MIKLKPTRSSQITPSSFTSVSLPSPQFWDSVSSKLPKSPGVYWFLNENKEVLYVGKAKNLKNRLHSYRLTPNLLPKTRALVEKIQATRIHPTENELTAILLEAELIRLHQPPYNIRLKDDKSPLYIGITKETYPRILRLRKNELSKYTLSVTFGPYDSSLKVTSVLKLIRRLFPYCTKKQNHTSNIACFYVHLGLCPGACNHSITPKEYARPIQNIKLFLKRKNRQLISSIKKAISEASNEEHYAKAASLKQQLSSLTTVLNSKSNLNMESHLPNLSIDQTSHQLKSLLQLLKQYLPIPNDYPIHRIEMYDIANLQFKHPTAAMVVFLDGQPAKREYRHFKMKSTSGPNDVAMIGETLERRVKHTEWTVPNLIIIDGGKGQLNKAREVVPWNIPIVSIAKHPDRLMISTKTKEIHQIRLDPNIPATNLLTQARNEAHRFSRRLMHHLLKKSYTA